MIDLRVAKYRRQRTAKIAALGLVWAIAAGAILLERTGGGRRPTAAKPVAAAKAQAAAVIVEIGQPEFEPGPLDCLATAATARVDIRSGTRSCWGSLEHRYRIAWTAEGGTFSFRGGRSPFPISREARQQFAAALASGVQRHADGGDSCTGEKFVELTWRCDGAPPAHASFSEADCPGPGLPPPTGPAHSVHEALVRLVLQSR